HLASLTRVAPSGPPVAFGIRYLFALVTLVLPRPTRRPTFRSARIRSPSALECRDELAIGAERMPGRRHHRYTVNRRVLVVARSATADARIVVEGCRSRRHEV